MRKRERESERKGQRGRERERQHNYLLHFCGACRNYFHRIAACNVFVSHLWQRVAKYFFFTCNCHMPLPITGNWRLATLTTSCSNASSTGPKMAHSERQTNSPANLRKRCDAMRNVNNFQISLEWEREK